MRRTDGGGKKQGRVCAERVFCVGAWRSTHFGRAPGLDRPPPPPPPALAAPLALGGAGRTPPFRLRGPHDSCLRCSHVTYQEREPRAPSRLPRVSQVGLGERDSHSGLCGLKVCFGGAEISLGANLLNPCLSPVAKRALSPAGVPTSSVEEIAGRGCFT